MAGAEMKTDGYIVGIVCKHGTRPEMCLYTAKDHMYSMMERGSRLLCVLTGNFSNTLVRTFLRR